MWGGEQWREGRVEARVSGVALCFWDKCVYQLALGF